MISFKNDYSEGAHPRILSALTATNFEQTDGYGEDPHTQNACRLIREALGAPTCDVHLLVGGTQTNLTFIAHALRPHQAVIAASTGHICTHESGAIEATGHKILTADAADGKLTPALVEALLAAHKDHHMVQPALVYVSNPTELGSLYSHAELESLAACCSARGLYLYLDGARLPAALASSQNDIEFRDLPALCDALYIGGTKCGALFGEALVLFHYALKADFRYMMKQRGALLAKGRLLGIQFEELFADGLYLELGRHADEMALQVREAFRACGYPFLLESQTNQQFPILPDSLIDELSSRDYRFEIWQRVDTAHSVARFVTSWATRQEQIDVFIRDLAACAKRCGK